MPNHELLTLNIPKLIRCLNNILSPAEIAKIKRSQFEHAQMLVQLAKSHLRHAKRHCGHDWRQCTSRAYYAFYTAGKAVRLAHDGAFDKSVKDHDNVTKLPDDFPQAATWAGFAIKFRGDRNLADYDHTATAKSLELSPRRYLDGAADFVRTCDTYIQEQAEHHDS